MYGGQFGRVRCWATLIGTLNVTRERNCGALLSTVSPFGGAWNLVVVTYGLLFHIYDFIKCHVEIILTVFAEFPVKVQVFLILYLSSPWLEMSYSNGTHPLYRVQKYDISPFMLP